MSRRRLHPFRFRASHCRKWPRNTTPKSSACRWAWPTWISRPATISPVGADLPIGGMRTSSEPTFLMQRMQHRRRAHDKSDIPNSDCRKCRDQTSMHPQYTALFTTIDKYVRARHRCFIAELDFSQTKWVMCIRPTEENIRDLARAVHAC